MTGAAILLVILRRQRFEVAKYLDCTHLKFPWRPREETRGAEGTNSVAVSRPGPVETSRDSGWKRTRPTPQQVITDQPWVAEAHRNGTAWVGRMSYARSGAAGRRFVARGRELKREYERKRDMKGKPPSDAAFTRTPGGCWEWSGHISGSGYGYVWGQPAHRLMYRHYKADIPAGLQLLHTCDNRKCVNPDHLIPGTAKQNMADMYEKGRARPYGKTQKLKPSQRKEIAARYHDGATATSLANEFGISASYVQRISGARRINYPAKSLIPPSA